MPSSPAGRITTKKRCSRSSDADESKSSSRETTPRMPTAALISSEISGDAPSGQRADGTVVLHIGAKKLANAHSPREQRQFVVFRHRRGGKKEILFRRVGRNELSTIRVCQELVAAERNTTPPSNDEYARKSSVTKASAMASIGKRLRRTPESHRATGSIGRCSGLC